MYLVISGSNLSTALINEPAVARCRQATRPCKYTTDSIRRYQTTPPHVGEYTPTERNTPPRQGDRNES